MTPVFKVLAPVIFAGLLVASGRPTQQVGQTVTKRGTITQDLYLAGGTVEVRADVQGDVIAAGGRILIEQRVTGDVLVAGGDVTITAEVLDDVRAAGGSVLLGGRISGDAIATGGTVRLQPDATVGGRAWFGGGDVDVEGRIATHLKAGAERITISGVIDGDVEITAEEIDVLPSARITGTLTYRSRREARIDPAAQIGGGVTRLPVERRPVATQVAGRLLFIAALGVLGAALILVFPGFSMATVRSLGAEPWKAVGLGALVLVGGPVMAIVLMVTVVGVALGFTLLVAYGLALVTGCLVGALYAGDAVLKLLRRAPSTSVGELVAALCLGLIGLSLVGFIPVVGGLVRLAVLLVGLGALALTAFRGWKRWRAGSGIVGAAAA
ncbi:MAG TPA: polymer-forming cytoskeletal protein [Gemmatimonadales bacterium]